MKILLASDGHAGTIYADALQGAFQQLGHTTSAFHWRHFFHNYPYAPVYPTEPSVLKSIYYRAQNKFTLGPAVWALNRALLAQCQAERPNLVFIYRGTHVWPSTLRAIKKLGAVVFGYNNDDPFSPQYPAYVWRHFLRGVPHYHHLFAYRIANLADYAARGYHATSLLRSYYVAANNRPVPPNPALQSEVAFIGHYEPDGRDETVLKVLAAGIPLRLRGTNWEASPHYATLLQKLGQTAIQPLYGAAYNEGLSSAKIALVFLSKLNRDSYTRRNFEIPATGSCMVSEYTEDLAKNLFTPNQEAVYFKTPEELVSQLQNLLVNPARIQQIGQAGQARLHRDGHEVIDRARQVLQVYDALKTSQ
jgi:spore maturation protein CgeB